MHVWIMAINTETYKGINGWSQFYINDNIHGHFFFHGII